MVVRLHLGMRASSIFNTQHVATGWSNARNMLCPTTLRYVASKCAIVWSELANIGPTMLGYVAIIWLELKSHVNSPRIQ